MSSITEDDVILALVAAAKAAPGLAGVDVLDGAVVDAEQGMQRLFIGGAGDDSPGAAVVDISDTLPEYLTAEQINVTCTVQCWTGDDDMALQRARALAIVDELRKLCRPNLGLTTLGLQALAWARLTSRTYTPQQTSSGAYAVVQVLLEAQCRPEAT